MTRLLTLVIHNWPLKIAAIGLASLLYAGLVLSQNVQTFNGPIPILPLNQPTDAVLVGNLTAVTDIRYVAPSDVAGRLTRSSFSASIDLSNAHPTPQNPFISVPVRLDPADNRVTILDYQPKIIQVQLDPLTRKSVPVQVDQGPIPSGLNVGPPTLSVQDVTVSGPDSAVRQVVAARAQIVIQPAGLDVHQDVPLVAVDAVGNPVSPVDLEPASVHVDVAVGSLAVTRSLAVNPVVTGSPAAGQALDSVTVSPAVVTLRGDADALASLTRIDTAPISIANATTSSSTLVGLALPPGVTVLSGANVTVTIRLRAVAQTRDFTAGLVLSGARDDRVYDLSTDRVVVTIGGPVAALDGLQGASFTATVDVSSLAIGDHPVQVQVNLPAGLAVQSISPPSVTVTVAAPAPSPTSTPQPSAS